METLSIEKREVFKEVEKRSSLEASTLPDDFERLWASQYEGGFLDTYWIEACSMAVQLLKRYIRGETVEHKLYDHNANERLVITVRMPHRFDYSLIGSIATDLKMMMASHVLAGWLSVQAADRAAKYADEAKAYAEALRLKLAYRTEPVRGMTLKGNDRLTLNQYEGCDHCIEPWGDNGGCDECRPPHRP